MDKRRKGIVALSILVVILFVAGIGFYQNGLESSRAIQEKIDMGGYGLYVDCYGNGRPTVIFEAGLGSTHGDWKYIQPEIAKIARTFSYDRAGLGKSEKSSGARTVSDQVKELHSLLKKTKVKGPYVFVAHSIGGFHARLFADMYPAEVTGIVFIDSTSENQSEFYEKEFDESQLNFMKRMFNNAKVSYDELVQSELQVKTARAKNTLKNIPIIVLSTRHNENDAMDSISKLIARKNGEWQEDIASLSDKSVHTIVEDSGQMIQLDQPKIVIDAIKEMIDMIK